MLICYNTGMLNDLVYQNKQKTVDQYFVFCYNNGMLRNLAYLGNSKFLNLGNLER
jgi:hypothetical protein